MLNKEAIKTVADVADVQQNLHLLMPYVGDTNETK